ncbi:MAG: hypothetical protein HYY52_05250 [Candidatus Melainabacteria bacterium]|nr:hypothetical protein [Candidatus Melainabacteria bacterium]
MYIANPINLTAMYVENDSNRNMHRGLLNANFQDYMDSLKQGGQLQTSAGRLRQKVSALASSLGLAAGVFGGPMGLSLGYAVGNAVGKYVGNVLSNRIYGQAMADMNDIAHEARVRHTQLAASVAFIDQIDGALDTLRQNENKRKKDDLGAMSV